MVILTPKQKAASLVLSFLANVNSNIERAKECALIVVREIELLVDDTMKGWLDADIKSYWAEVKEEIKKCK